MQLQRHSFVVLPCVMRPEHAEDCSLLQTSTDGGGVVASPDVCYENLMTMRSESVRKRWDQVQSDPPGERTYLRRFTVPRVENECEHMIVATLEGACLLPACSSSSSSHNLFGFRRASSSDAAQPWVKQQILQNEERAGKQMLHFDLPVQIRNEGVTVIAALWESVPLRVVDPSSREQLPVNIPNGSMIVMSGYCLHAGTDAKGTGPRLFAVVLSDKRCISQHRLSVKDVPGTYPF